MKRVLVTGATGFIGRHTLAPLRERGYEVHAVSSRAAAVAAASAGGAGARDGAAPSAGVGGGSGSGPRDGVVRHVADLLDPRATVELVEAIEPTHLLHLAWYAEPGKFWTSPENERWVAASRHLARAFADIGGRRMVVAGTSAEYDWSAGGVCLEGVTPLRPGTVYGRAKAALSADLQRTYGGQRGAPALAWGRIFLVYGPGEHPARLVSSVVKALVEGRLARCTHGRQVRDFFYSAEVAAGFVAVLDNDDVTGPVNVASGQPVTIADLVGLIGRACRRPELIELGALPAREDEPQLLVADVSRLRDEVGFRPSVDLASGVAATVDWWRRELERG